jgi:hypothetical protein
MAALELTTNRVEIPPGYDLWMMGARFGTIKRYRQGIAHIKMDHPQVTRLAHIPVADLVLYGRILPRRRQ